MQLTKRAKIVIGVVAIVSIVAIGTPLLAMSLMNQNSNSIRLTLLYNAGVMIEFQGVRIYVDPIDLSDDYAAYPADIILITHPHGDHYQSSVIDMLQKEGTVNIFPENMSDAIIRHSGIGMIPEEQQLIGQVRITAFYMYTFSLEGFPATHPREAQWTSYIIEINEFTFFHAGDSKNIVEYSQLTGQIDVAMLPLGPGCQTMTGQEVVDAIDQIQPRYFIPIHYATGANDAFITTYSSQITECQIVNLEYYQSFVFSI